MRVGKLLNPIALIGLSAALVGGTGTAVAATGGTFLLGRSNTASTVTSLTNSQGTALSLISKTGTPPLTVSSTVKVPRLNSDLLDGLNSTSLQRRVTGTCTGGAISSIGVSGGVSCSKLPTKVVRTIALPEPEQSVAQVLAIFGGNRLVLECHRYMYDYGPHFIAIVRVEGTQGSVNGHSVHSYNYGDHVNRSINGEIPSAVFDTSAFGGISAGTITAMVESAGVLTQLQLHVKLDATNTTATAKPCSVWGVIT